MAKLVVQCATTGHFVLSELVDTAALYGAEEGSIWCPYCMDYHVWRLRHPAQKEYPIAHRRPESG